MATAAKKDPETVDESSRALPGPPNPPAMQQRAEDLPERDPVEKAHKDALTADDHQAEAKAKAKIVDESRDAADTPSGHALKEVAGIKDDRERGEAYEREKAAKRSR